MPAETPPSDARRDQHLDARCERRQQTRRNGEPDAEEEQHLAAVSVADGTQPEHRCGEAQGVADGDQVQRGLGGVERGADRRQRDVGDGEVEVRNGRDDDQRREDQSPTLGTRGNGRRPSGGRRPRDRGRARVVCHVAAPRLLRTGRRPIPGHRNSGFEARSRRSGLSDRASPQARWYGTDANTRRYIWRIVLVIGHHPIRVIRRLPWRSMPSPGRTPRPWTRR